MQSLSEDNNKSPEKPKSRLFYVLLLLLLTDTACNLLSSILKVWVSSAIAQSTAFFLTSSILFYIVFYNNRLAVLLGLISCVLGAISLFLMSGLHLPQLPILTS